MIQEQIKQKINEQCYDCIYNNININQFLIEHTQKDKEPDFFKDNEKGLSSLFAEYIAYHSVENINAFKGNEASFYAHIHTVFTRASQAISHLDDVFSFQYSKKLIENFINLKNSSEFLEKMKENKNYGFDLSLEFKKKLVQMHNGYLTPDQDNQFINGLIIPLINKNQNTKDIKKIIPIIEYSFECGNSTQHILKELTSKNIGIYIIDDNGSINKDKRNQLLNDTLNSANKHLNSIIPEKLEGKDPEELKDKILNCYNKLMTIMAYLSQRDTIDLKFVEYASNTFKANIKHKITHLTQIHSENTKNFQAVAEQKINKLIYANGCLTKHAENHQNIIFINLKEHGLHTLVNKTQKSIIDDSLALIKKKTKSHSFL